MTRAIMNGCNGKMGQCITGICAQDPDIEIVAGIDTYDGIKNDYPVFKSLADCDVEADVIIDFSNAKAVDALIDHCVVFAKGAVEAAKFLHGKGAGHYDMADVIAAK